MARLSVRNSSIMFRVWIIKYDYDIKYYEDSTGSTTTSRDIVLLSLLLLIKLYVKGRKMREIRHYVMCSCLDVINV